MIEWKQLSETRFEAIDPEHGLVAAVYAFGASWRFSVFDATSDAVYAGGKDYPDEETAKQKAEAALTTIARRRLGAEQDQVFTQEAYAQGFWQRVREMMDGATHEQLQLWTEGMKQSQNGQLDDFRQAAAMGMTAGAIAFAGNIPRVVAMLRDFCSDEDHVDFEQILGPPNQTPGSDEPR